MPDRRAVLFALAAAPALAAGAARAASRVHAVSGIAIGGVDPVGYFREGRVVQGAPEIAVMWRDAIWHFASAETRMAFENDPRRFAPAYGGYCAYAVSENYLAPIDPSAWTLHEGRLYLNAGRRAQRLFRADLPGRIAAAERNWPGVLR
ncbi:hypothetical protein SAMN04490244_106197 [Tranquillimonas rosea]|uniref:YHS domain-containing protein n=1 Tax=Tranquillimonas rosea TaxID=641238 RepID=A0A1H9V2L0_9RHOB|nr:YHS domain-containing (seleno)protein [Tranquillimonas rosea]SES15828.1 hypothetical protein SAMN04490244_106197 [Tranquillimonas rosea]